MSSDNSTRYNNFNKFIRNNSLIDLGYIGNPFTWHNKRGYEDTIFSCLDRGFANHYGYSCIQILFLKVFPYLDQITPRLFLI